MSLRDAQENRNETCKNENKDGLEIIVNKAYCTKINNING